MLNAKTSPIPAGAEPAINRLGTLRPVKAFVTDAVVSSPFEITALV